MNKKLHFIVLLLFAHVTVIGQTNYTISDPEDIESLALVAGDVVTLLDGTYSSDERIKFIGTGTDDLPITFRPETPGGVLFDGGLKLSIGGDYLIVDGFHWKGGYGASNFIEFRNGSVYANHSTIQKCAIDGLEIEPDELLEGLMPEDPDDRPSVVKHRWIVLYGTYNNVINCSFMNKSSAGVIILAEYEFNASPDEGITNTRCNEVGHTITNNYFYNFQKIDEIYSEYKVDDNQLSNAGDSETMRIGTSEFQNVHSNNTISNNYFVQADGENEIISNKSRGNIYVNNTFRRCRGSLVLRHGSDAIVDGNIFLGENVEGTGGIRIADSNHTITNNYIQDCITVVNQAIWNNGITFMGGGVPHSVVCTSTSTSSGYQRSENITLSNNTLVNTNAPLFFNSDRGTTNVTGTVSNNLIYFEDSSSNLTPVFSGDVDSAYSDFGTELIYAGNVFNGTVLGVDVEGFSEDNGISSVVDGELFNFELEDKGANLGNYQAVTDDMVGNGIGACFLDYLGNSIADPSCTIEIADFLRASSNTTFTFEEGSTDISVNSNVSWRVITNNDWISLDVNSGTGEGIVNASFTENDSGLDRSGSITFSQPGGDLSRVITFVQMAAPLPDPRLSYTLINDGSDTDNVSVEFASDEEVTATKNNIASNSLDKDFDTNWSGNGIDAEIVYDLGGSFNLGLIDYLGSEGKTHDFQIWISTSGIVDTDFSQVVFEDRVNGRGNLNTNGTDELEAFEFPSIIEGVTFVKIKGFGQPGGSGSTFNTITEIDFYGDGSTLSSPEFIDSDVLGVKLYPNPITNDILYMESSVSDFQYLNIYSVLGSKLLSIKLDTEDSLKEINLGQLDAGIYFVEIVSQDVKTMKRIIVSK